MEKRQSLINVFPQCSLHKVPNNKLIIKIQGINFS